MNKLGKIVIVIALVVAVALVIALKRKSSSEAEHVSARPLPVKVVPQQPSSVETNTVAVKPQPAKALPRLVDLGARKCIPCKMMAPILEELKKEYTGTFSVEFIDVWENPKAGREYGIRLIPTQIFYDASGKELFRHEGFFSKDDILAKWKQLGVELTKAK